MKIRDLPAGHGWAYAGVILGLVASVAGNVANTVLFQSDDVPLQLRIALAVFWPVALGVGIEVLTRINWRGGWKHWAARAILVGPLSLVAAIVSYGHLHHLMLMAGENGTAQGLGPLAIDGTLFGCTVALLVTRVSGQKDPAPEVLTVEVPGPERIVTREVLPDLLPIAPLQPRVPEVPKVPARRAPEVPEATEVLARRVPVSTGRYLAWDIVKAVHVLMDPEDTRGDLAVAELVGVGSKTITRVRRAVRLLKENPHASVPAAWKVPTAVVQVIRQEVTR